MTRPARRKIAIIRCGGLLDQHHVSTLISFLRSNQYVITIYVIQCHLRDIEAFRSEHPGIVVNDIGRFGKAGFLRFIRGGLALGKQLKLSDSEIHYVIDSWTLRYYKVAQMFTAFKKNILFVYHTFDMLSPEIAAWYERLLEKRCARNANLVVVTDPSRSALMKSLYRLCTSPLALPVRMSCTFEQPNREAINDLRSSFMKNGLKKLVICPTRVSRARRGVEIIEAFSETPEDYALIIFEGSAEYSRTCKQLAINLGKQHRIFILPEVSNSEVILATAASDVALIYHDEMASLGNFFCHPSRLAYCAALGIPVIANDVPSIEAVVYKYDLGVCVDLSDKDQFVKAVIDICADELLHAKRKSAIRAAFYEHMCFEVEGNKLKAALFTLGSAGT